MRSVALSAKASTIETEPSPHSAPRRLPLPSHGFADAAPPPRRYNTQLYPIPKTSCTAYARTPIRRMAPPPQRSPGCATPAVTAGTTGSPQPPPQAVGPRTPTSVAVRLGSPPLCGGARTSSSLAARIASSPTTRNRGPSMGAATPSRTTQTPSSQTPWTHIRPTPHCLLSRLRSYATPRQP